MGRSRCLLVALGALLLSGCGTINLKMTYEPATAPHPIRGAGSPRLLLSRVEDRTAKVFTLNGPMVATFNPPVETFLRESLQTELGRLGARVVLDHGQADAFLRATLTTNQFVVASMVPPSTSLALQLTLMSPAGNTLWETTVVGNGAANGVWLSVKSAELAYNRALAALMDQLGSVFEEQNVFAKILTPANSAVAAMQLGGAAGVSSGKPHASDVDRPEYKLKERPNDFALVVGIGKYSDIPEAQFAERDALAVRDHLIAEGFPSRNVIELLGEKAGRSSLEKFLETWLPRNINENSRVFFYFSGHGAPNPQTGEAYLMPWDADPGFLENTGYPIKRLYEKLSSLKAKEVIVAMDACFSGAGGRSVLAKGARPLVLKVDTAAVPQALTVFAAASGEQITSTLEDQGHGTFTYYFLKGLSGGAKDSSGRVTTQALYDYLKPKVQDAARRQNRDQDPVLHGPGDRELLRF